MNSFIPWIGGKKALRNTILEHFPVDGTYDRYIEPFGGAGWVLFHKERHAKLEVLNDANGQLVNLYKCIKHHPEELQRELDYLLVSREQFFDAKAQVDVRGLTDIQRAAKYYTMIKLSFGANTQEFLMTNRNLENAIKRFGEVQERLKMVVVEQKDFENLISVYDRKTALFYLDPPYYGTETMYQNVDFTKADHERLATALGRINGKFVLSYNADPFILELYKDYEISHVEHQNNLQSKGGKPQAYKEVIIRNFK